MAAPIRGFLLKYNKTNERRKKKDLKITNKTCSGRNDL